MPCRNRRHAWPQLLLWTLICSSLVATGCGGGGYGGGPTAPAVPAIPSIGSAAARVQALASGLGNPTASLTVTGQVTGRLTKVTPKGKVETAASALIVTDKGTYSAVSDSAGNFSLTLPASRYTLTISAPGYRTLSIQDVPVLASQATDITSEVAALQAAGERDTDRSDPSRPVVKAVVGSPACRGCHPQHFDAFMTTRHTQVIRYINDPNDVGAGLGVVGDFSPDAGKQVKTLSFTDTAIGTATARLELRKTSDNRYFVKLLDNTGGGSHEYEALRTHGGTGQWKQRYQTKLGGSWYTLPIQWNEKETDPAKRWVKYNVGDWFGSNGNVRVRTSTGQAGAEQVYGPTQANSYERKCYGCHGPVEAVQRVDGIGAAGGQGFEGDYVVNASAISVSCENCHGPGYPHIQTRAAQDIVNPSKNASRPNKLSYARANEVCGQCHVRGVSRGHAPSVAGISETTAQREYEFPWTTNDQPYRLGTDLLATAYNIAGTSKYWNTKYTRDVKSYQHHQQWLDNSHGAHSFDSAQVTCFDCHDPHGLASGANKHLLRASADDNSLCLTCHGKTGTARTRFLLPGETSTDASVRLVTSHTKHGYDPAGSQGAVSSRCTACHMPRTASSALKWDISAHSMRLVRPVESLDMLDNGGDKSAGLVVPHSCASQTVGCHASPASPGGQFLVGTGDLRQDATARGKLVAAVNAFESLFGTRKATGTDVTAISGALEGTVSLGGVPIEGARVMTDRGEDSDETGADGKFRLVLPKGTYNLYAVHPSLKTTSLEAVTVLTGAVNGGFRLELGALAQGQAAHVGSQKCKTCHADIYDRWQGTLHNKGIRYLDAVDNRDPGSLVVADFGAEGAGRTIRSTESDFSALGTAEIRLRKSAGVYTVTLVNGDSSIAGTYTPERSYGGGRGDWKQRFVVKLGNSSYILPIQWSESRSRWKTYNLANWFNSTTKVFTPPAKAKSFEYQCTGCHATGLEAEYRTAATEVFTKFVEMNTGCEACHGPGGDHYRTGDPAKIVNPDKAASNSAKLDSCTVCHGRGNSTIKPNGSAATEYGIASQSETAPGVFRLGLWSPGTNSPVFAYGQTGSTPFFSNDVTTLDDRYWNSSTWTVTSSTADASFVPVPTQVRASIKHHQQGNDMRESAHFGAGVNCWSCHDPHGSENSANLLRTDGNLVVNEQINTNSLCLTCHGPTGMAAKRFSSLTNMRAHYATHSFLESEGLACSSCHMPKTAQTVEKWDIRSHSFQAISPQVSLDQWLSGGNKNSDPTRRGTGTTASDDIVQNACSGCHTTRTGSLSAYQTGVTKFNTWKGRGGGQVQ